MQGLRHSDYMASSLRAKTASTLMGLKRQQERRRGSGWNRRDDDDNGSASTGNGRVVDNNSYMVQAGASALLQERLDQVLVLELLKEGGGRNYLTLSVRGLYKHVLAAITTPPPNSEEEGEQDNAENNSNQQAEDQSGRLPFKEEDTTTEQTQLPSLRLPPAALDTISTDASTGASNLPTPPPSTKVILGSIPSNLQEATPPEVGSLLTPPAAHTSFNPEVEISFLERTVASGDADSLNASPTAGAHTPASSASATATSQPPPPTAGFASPTSSSFAIKPPGRVPRQKSVTGAFGKSLSVPDVANNNNSSVGVTYRERLGGYLHPRDMRKLVTPFSASNEPDLIVRRHVMLLNFDPLRCIVLRDRLLVLVPDGADSILVDLERRVRGGNTELERIVFGPGNEVLFDLQDDDEDVKDESEDQTKKRHSALEGADDDDENSSRPLSASTAATASKSLRKASAPPLFRRILGNAKQRLSKTSHASSSEGGAHTSHSRHRRQEALSRAGLHSGEKLDSAPTHVEVDEISSEKTERSLGTAPETEGGGGDNEEDVNQFSHEVEWADIEGQEWVHLPFELQCIDAVFQTVVGLLSDETYELQHATLLYIESIINGDRDRAGVGFFSVLWNKHEQNLDDPLTIIRAVKDSVREMMSRVKGFVQSMNTILDDYEDMALMNLSRLLTHPERFIQPVPPEVLEEESDEPELLLESHLQQGLSLVNALDLIQGQIDTAAELVDQKLDATRNKILLANTIITTVALSVDCAMLVAGLFGMNLINHFEDSETAFVRVTFWTLAASVALFFASMTIMYRTGAIPSWGNVSQ